MPNMPSTNKHQMNVRLTLEAYRRLLKMAESGDQRPSELAQAMIEDRVRDVELTSEDCAWIAQKVRENEAKRGC